METHEQLLEVETLISPVLSDHGLTLVDLEWRREGRRWVLRLFVDKKEKGEEPKEGREMEPGEPKAGKERVTIADCQRVSLEIGDVLDASGFIRESYDLEVSSPGLDRELKKEREFRWATGKTVRCWVSRSVDGRTEFTGHLKGFTADVIRLEEPGGHLRELPRSLVTRARLELDFSRPR